MDMKIKEGKKGQVSLFIIIAIIIVIMGILIYLFYPKIKATFGLETQSPSEYLQTCLEEDFENIVDNLSLKGGELNPEHYFIYENQQIKYLCYTENYYETCVNQEPMLKNSIEEEIEEKLGSKINECSDAMKENFENRGYIVNLQKGESDVELLPKRILLRINSTLVLQKEGSQNYDSFSIILNNNLYELVSIANSIINWEAHYGDSEITTYMNYYHDIKVEKKKQSDGTTVYILTDRDTRDKFQFASRSVAWPAGY